MEAGSQKLRGRTANFCDPASSQHHNSGEVHREFFLTHQYHSYVLKQPSDQFGGGRRSRRHSAAGAMPERTGRWLTGVARRDPETVRKELVSATSSFFLCGLLHQTGAQYSAAEKTRAWVKMRKIFVAAPKVVLAR